MKDACLNRLVFWQNQVEQFVDEKDTIKKLLVDDDDSAILSIRIEMIKEL
jgi:hypothetical protein